MASPFDFTKWLDNHPYSQSSDLSPFKRIEAIFDASEAAVENGTAILANDVFQMITVPANSFVLNVRAEVLTAEGAASTFDVGDGATADGYINGQDGNAVASVTSFNATTTPTFGVGKFYSAADTIDIKMMTGTWTNLRVKLTATIAKL